MSKAFKKNSWKKIISVVLVIASVVGVLSFISFSGDKEVQNITSFDFIRGGVDELTGVFVETDKSLVTEDLFACKGLKILPDFKNTSEYQVFWYNQDQIFLGASDVIAPNTKMVGSVPGAAVYARVAIYPNEVDADGKNISDFKIKFWEVRKYANTFEIEVPKDQESLQQNLINDVLVYDESMGNISTALVNHKNIMFKNSCFSSSNTITDDNIVESENHNLLILDVSKVAVYRLDLTESSIQTGVYFY